MSTNKVHWKDLTFMKKLDIAISFIPCMLCQGLIYRACWIDNELEHKLEFPYTKECITHAEDEVRS
jgi:hypothetical protein